MPESFLAWMTEMMWAFVKFWIDLLSASERKAIHTLVDAFCQIAS